MNIKTDNRIFVDSSFNIFFPRNINIRQKVFVFEEKLKDKYRIPAQMLPIPDNIEAEMPRFTFISNKAHSLINISQINASIMVKFTNDYQKNYEKCEEYLEERIRIICGITREILDNDIKYCGLLTKIHYLLDKDKEKELLKYLCEKFISKGNYNDNIRDINLKYTNIENDKYFINFNISNIRNYSSDKAISGPISFSELKLENIGIQIILDVNDRYAFNKDCKYRSTEKEINKIFKLTKDIINTKLDSIITTGGIKLC